MQQLCAQSVKESQRANVSCVLPGSSGKVIIPGAHFDHVSEGHGVVDNWSGASLLPALYQAVKNEPRKHTYMLMGFTGEEKGIRRHPLPGLSSSMEFARLRRSCL
jgi:Zn-dependent M28 family amino/carboxypeptidase